MYQIQEHKGIKYKSDSELQTISIMLEAIYNSEVHNAKRSAMGMTWHSQAVVHAKIFVLALLHQHTGMTQATIGQ